ncbi:hypothetical protein CLAFUW4_10161 [Fulvia fulva]|uniref:Uncharacterized protein n=1 Tax=Passalora fulva TaxID=5499 RepID=A0A9Q8P871_PASFU|nr:uncharacterized protein CLAFUR5_04774 [Fulvia fulva]UJO16890.1 hypothetical protein CLAFUR5_04774 [Fulvia fulva]WPV18883.1 hypothetical protein CLAFUW4_10161 [Fulvia fulva]
MPSTLAKAVCLLQATLLTATATRNCVLGTHKFDDITPNPLLPQLQPSLGPYNGLSYNFRVAPQGLPINIIPGLKITLGPTTPASERNVIGAGAIHLDGLIGGQLGPQGIITATGKTKHFDLDSVYYACMINILPQVALPRPCTLTATEFGWDEGEGKYVRRSTEALAYTPDALQRAGMLFFEFRGLRKMREVTFGVADGRGGGGECGFVG